MRLSAITNNLAGEQPIHSSMPARISAAASFQAIMKADDEVTSREIGVAKKGYRDATLRDRESARGLPVIIALIDSFVILLGNKWGWKGGGPELRVQGAVIGYGGV